MRIAILAAAMAAALLPATAMAETGMRADLVVAGGDPAEPGTARAGVRVRLDDGWKTYWRSPGEDGIPSEFDWSGSTNVRSVSVSWPAPHRIRTPYMETVGYTGEVVFPVEVVARDPSRPVRLSLHLALYGCATQCVREDLDLSASVPAAPADASAMARAAGWAARVPSVGGHGGLRVVSAVPAADGLRVTLSSGTGLVAPDIFVESGAPSLSGAPARLSGDARAAEYLVPMAGGPGKGPWAVTAVDGSASAFLDAQDPAPGRPGGVLESSAAGRQ